MQPHETLLTQAEHHFKQHDPIMHHLLLRAVQHPTSLPRLVAKPQSQYFAALTDTIIGQQISTAAARTIRERLRNHLGDITPETIRAQQTTLATAGISPQKARYLSSLAEAWPKLPIDQFSTHSDAELTTILTALPGIGPWSAEMFLLFTLGRPDIFSYRDLGLMQSIYTYYNFYPNYTRKIQTTVDRWSPYRSVASLTLWHARDTRAPLEAFPAFNTPQG